MMQPQGHLLIWIWFPKLQGPGLLTETVDDDSLLSLPPLTGTRAGSKSDHHGADGIKPFILQYGGLSLLLYNSRSPQMQRVTSMINYASLPSWDWPVSCIWSALIDGQTWQAEGGKKRKAEPNLSPVLFSRCDPSIPSFKFFKRALIWTLA